MNTRLKIGIISRAGRGDREGRDQVLKRQHLSSTARMARSLQRFHDVGLVEYAPGLPSKAALLLLRAYFKSLPRKRFDGLHTFLYSRSAAHSLDRSLRHNSYDILLAPKGSSEIAFLKSPTPVVYHSDATFRLVTGYLKAYTNLPGWNIRQGEAIEKRALEKAAHVVMVTEWA